MFDALLASVDDVEFLERVERECFTDPWNENMLLGEIEQPNSDFYIFRCNEVAVGYFSFMHIFDEAHIMNVAVLPEFQGMGYGRAMMESLLEVTKANGLFQVTLEVRKGNRKAIGLYESFGFVKQGVRPRYYMDGEDAVIYWLYRQ